MEEACITALRAMGRNAAKTLIEINHAPWAEITTEVVLEWGLKKKQILTQQDQQQLLRDDAFRRARRAAAIYLHARRRSAREVQRKLRHLDFDPETTAKTIEHFRELGHIDDLEFARTFVTTRQSLTQWGPGKIRNRLRALGVPAALIDRALEENSPSPDIQRAQAQALLAKKDRPTADPLKRRRRLQGILQRAGYPPEISHAVLEEFLKDTRQS